MTVSRLFADRPDFEEFLRSTLRERGAEAVVREVADHVMIHDPCDGSPVMFELLYPRPGDE